MKSDNPSVTNGNSTDTMITSGTGDQSDKSMLAAMFPGLAISNDKRIISCSSSEEVEGNFGNKSPTIINVPSAVENDVGDMIATLETVPSPSKQQLYDEHQRKKRRSRSVESDKKRQRSADRSGNKRYKKRCTSTDRNSINNDTTRDIKTSCRNIDRRSCR